MPQSKPPEIGDTVRVALGRERWTFTGTYKLSGGDYARLERKESKGSVVTYVLQSSLVKVEE